jgi:TonB family protein
MLNTGVNRRPVPRVASVTTALLLLTITASIAGLQGSSQSFSTLAGTVFDPQGRFLTGATLTLSNERTESTYQVRSGETGQFEFVGLPAGDYVLEADLRGFKTFRDRLSVAAGSVQRDITLEVGSLTETIVVAGGGNGTGEPLRMSIDEDAGARLQRLLGECRASTTESTSAGGKLRPPKKLKHVSPRYPEALRNGGVGGVVKLETTIDTEGSVKDVKLAGPEIDPELTAAAVEAVNQWVFDATLLNCVPVEVTMNVSIEFRPIPPAPPAAPPPPQ